jgi:hypothetical protein
MSQTEAKALTAIRAAVERRRKAFIATDTAVIAARDAGVSWPDIAEALGVSTPAAHQLYRNMSEPRAKAPRTTWN